MRQTLFIMCYTFLLLCSSAIAATQPVAIDGNPTIFINATATPKNPYVQSQILYQIKIYYNINVPSASISPPQAKNAIIKQLGQDQTYSTKIKGATYQVFQRNYVIFPQNSGPLEISPAIFRGQITEKSASSYAGFVSLNVKPVQLIAPAMNINVEAIPAAATSQWWLPTSNLTVTEDWSASSNQTQVGEPITRIITFSALGLMSSQLPQFNNENSSNFNSYVSPAELKDTLVNNQLVGIKTEKIVYIPTAPGIVIFPNITVQWWNISTNQLETIELPSKSLNVIPGINSATVETAPPATIASVPTLTSTLQKSSQHFNLTLSFIFFISLMIIILLMVLLIGWKMWRNKVVTKLDCFASLAKTNRQGFLKSSVSISLKQACENNNPLAAKKALIQWAQQKFISLEIHSINDILQHIQDASLKIELDQLQIKLYKQSEIVWSGKNLWKCCNSFKEKKDVKRNQKEYLPPLHPNQIK